MARRVIFALMVLFGPHPLRAQITDCTVQGASTHCETKPSPQQLFQEMQEDFERSRRQNQDANKPTMISPGDIQKFREDEIVTDSTKAKNLAAVCSLEGGDGMLACLSYYQGYRDATTAAQAMGQTLVCFPKEETALWFQGALIDFLKQNPKLNEVRRDVVVTMLLKSRYPCTAQ